MKLFLSPILALAMAVHKVQAHLAGPLEPERIRQVDTHDASSFAAGDRAKEDYSMDNPFDIVKAVYQGLSPAEKPQRLPSTASFVGSRLMGKDDVDYFMYDMSNPDLATYAPGPNDPPKEYMDFAFYAIPIYCREYKHFHPNVAMMGPISTVDVNGAAVFREPTVEEKEVLSIPEGYGVIVKKGNSKLSRVKGTDRDFYYSPHSGNSWFLPADYSVECIEDYSDPTCMASPEVITVLGIPYDPTTKPFYFAVWGSESDAFTGGFYDVDVVYGTTDKYLPSDWGRVGLTGPFQSHGKTLGKKCRPVE